MSTIDLRGATVSAADPPIGTNPNPDLAIKAPVRAATTGSGITLSGLQTIDGIALAAGDRVLVKDQTDATTNGIYNAQTSTWTRAIDANNNSQFAQGLMVAVAGGAVNANGLFRLTTANPITLGTSALTWSLTTPPIGVGGLTITPATLSPNQGLVISQNGAGTVGSAYSYNSIAITDNINAGANTVDGLSVFLGMAGSAVSGARQAFQSTCWLTQPTSPTNPNRNYVGGVFFASAISGDGGGLGTEKGAIFGCNPIATLTGAATHMASLVGGEVDIGAAAGSSMLDKYGWSIVQLSMDAVAGSRNDAALFFGNQAGAVGWGTLIQVGDALNASPLTTSGSIMAIKGSPTITNGIDLSGATISGSAFKSPGFSVDGSGLVRPSGINIGSAAPSFGVGLKFADNSGGQVLIAGATRGIRIWTDSVGGGGAHIEGVDSTGAISFQPLQINGLSLSLQSNGGAECLAFDSSTPPLVKFSTAGAWTANGLVATAMSSVGPTGSHTTIQEWFTVKNAGGTVRYIPAF
jgi:hypothetical protein